MTIVLQQNINNPVLDNKKHLLYPRKFFNRAFNIGEIDEIPYLIAMQMKSYNDFLQRNIPQNERKNIGIESIFQQVFPVVNETTTIEYMGYEMGDPKYDPYECQQRGVDYSASLKVMLRMIIWSIDENGNKEVDSIKEQVVYMGDIPLMTDSGTFVINGSQRVIVSQMHRSPGVFIFKDNGRSNSLGKYIYSARIIPYHGSWLDMEYDAKDHMYFRIDKKKKILLSTLLYALGLSREEIFKTFYEIKEYTYHDGHWISNFDILDFAGMKVNKEIISYDNEVLVGDNTRITPGIINKLKKKVGCKYYASEDEILGRYFADNITINIEDNNDIFIQSGDLITKDLLDYIKNRDGKISVLMMGGIKTGDYLRTTVLADKNTNREEALVEIYRILRPGEQFSLEVAEKSWYSTFFDPAKYNLSAIGRMKMNLCHGVNISEDVKVLRNEDIIEVIKNLLAIRDGNGEVDDIDSLSNRRIRAVGESIENLFRSCLSRNVRSIIEKASDSTVLHYFVNPRLLGGVIHEFFSTSPLSQFVDQTNLLSEITHSRRISALGPGGLDRNRAGFEARDVHSSHYNRMCPIETPEGPNVGLINSLAMYARINKYGFIETPYIKVDNGKITGEIHYLSSIEEQKYMICASNVERDKNAYILEKRVMCRKDGDFISVPIEEVSYIDLTATQIVSVAASLIPFLEHDDANRALMGANMQRQAVPLIRPQAPIVGTGTESVVAKNSGSVVLAKEDGIVESVDANRIVIISLDSNIESKIKIYNLNKYQKSNHNTLLNQIPIVNVGDYIKAGDVIADGSCTEKGELALGKNLLVAFMPWNGYNFEDAIVISERMVKDDVFTSIHIQQYVIEARDTRLGQEKFTPFIPNASANLLSNLDESGIIRIGAKVKGGDYLVGKVAPKGESLLTPEEKLLQAIFGEKASEVKDASLRVPPGESGTVIGVRIFTRKGIEKNERAILLERDEIEKYSRDYEDKIRILTDFVKNQAIEIFLGEKLIKLRKKILKNCVIVTKNLIENSKIDEIFDFVFESEELMIKLQNLNSFYYNYAQQFKEEFDKKKDRIQSGDDIPQGALQVIKIFIATEKRIQAGDKMAGRHGNKGVVSKIVPIEDMPFLEDGTPIDIVLNPIGVPSRMNIGQILETHLGWASSNLGKRVRKIIDNYYQQNDQKILNDLREELLKIYKNQYDELKINKNNDKICNDLKTCSDSTLLEVGEYLTNGIPFASPIFSGATENDINNILSYVGCDTSGQVKLIDGRTGEYFDRPISIGYIYMLKLDHLVYDKMHMRSTGPYGLVTQQPLGGRSHFGGQRFGEMECWALEAYGAAYTLHELSTIKSDDVVGRTKIYEKICNKEEGYISPSLHGPESFHVMVMELRSLCIDIQEVSIINNRLIEDIENSDNQNNLTNDHISNAAAIDQDNNQTLISEDVDHKKCNRRSINIIDLEKNPEDFVKSRDAISISLASPETIEKIWSHGEVKLPDTINYRTAKPERGGMFCAAIFGPIKDYECLCGKYKRMKYRGIICEKCGVEVTVSQKRRRRMAHIKLASPVVHIWFLRSLPSRISTLLDISLKDVERVLYFNVYIVSNPGLSHFQYGQIINDDEYHNALNQYGEGTFEAGMGANIIRKMLEEFNLHENRTILREELINCNSEIKRKKIVRRLRLIEDFIDSGVKPEWMVLTVLPVIPPDLRPLVMLDGGRFATSDLNELYRRVINRNNRLKRLLELKAPEVIVHNEMRMLQESVDALLDNGRRGKTVTTTNKRPLKSLADMLKGKQGRFRQNLLGKRVDYSGRSVIIAGPHLKLNQCGLPKKMALELFKPFVYARLEKRQIAITISAAKKIVEAETPEVWDILREVTREHPVLLNRAPTLHRLGIQAFEPILIDGMAIQLHPLVCTAFNADFDGDQMAVHIPLSPEAQSEARILMASTKNILSPANGKPIIVPSQDIIQGLYYLTIELPGQKGEGMIFASFAEVEYAVFFKLLDISARIKCRYKILDLDGKYVTRLIETTAGRLIFAEALPENCKIRFDQINKQMNKKEVSNLIESVYKNSGQKNTVKFADNIMQLGFKYACKSGLSFGKDDMVVPHTKTKHVNDAKEEVKQYEMQYSDGLITSGERYNKVVDTWSRCTDLIGSDVLKYISLNKNGYPIKNVSEINSIFMMADSGARGSAAQIRQLAGMRGLMTKPSGEIIETPIVSNFREGLSVYEYFNSTHGTRKGLADTALKTANSGYLTRKLVDVSQDCIVITDDCNTDKSITVGVVMENGEIVVPLRDRILGRVAAIDIYYPIQDKLVIKKNEVIDEKVIDILEEAGIDSIKVRSPIMCDTKGGICVKCYGRDLSNGKLVKIGTAVGIIAAQSIGEPGTQLTMRTFHIGGAAQKAVLQSSAIAAHGGILRLSHKNIVIDSKENKIVMSRNCEAIIIDEKGCEITRCKLPYGSSLLFDEYDNIKIGAKLAEWDPFTIPVITEKTGIISLVDLIKDVSVKEVIDEVTGMTSYVVMDSKSYKKTAGDLHPSIVLQDQDGKVLILANGMEAKYHLPVNAILSVKDKDNVNAGDIIARIPKESSKSRDITGGLPRVVEMFEARYPKDHSIISEIDGYVEFTKDYKSKRHIIIRSDTNPDHFVEYFIARGHNITVQDGDYVKRGYLLMEGSPSPHEILRIMGVEALTHHIVEEVQQVYRLQGVNISDIHIEVIVKQMLRKVEITRPNGTVFLEGEKVDREEFEEINRKTIALGYEPAECMWVLQGITKSSLQTSSFLAAASFQETTRVITNAALAGKTDELRGLKENVIVGKLVPSGSGYCFMKVKDQALIRDREVRKKLEEQIKDEKLQESIDKLENDNEISVASS